ncbi:VOC family protein [Nocardia sp. CDC159]|uniref:VOC family protein n=1 Tax=Nocardia pulmonis TaxID=2951408 RepID=A0A9X2IWG6_9NOCA|nr:MULTISPECIES: VOC family protein [Nocardia]MCM6774293.1 VOC family protein [Nocardia pulmonis]MCM6787180.1 VOC family protein [Nocardia sp. CDC159]
MIRWNWAFIDRPAEVFDEACAFWATASGTIVSERGGDNGEFATLEPARGDACLRAQAVGGPGGAHLDLDVAEADLDAARQLARKLGAELLADHGYWSLVRSPGGVLFCLTTGDGREIPPPIPGPRGALSRVDQVTLDIPGSRYDDEVRFWSELTGWELRETMRPEFLRLGVPDELPIRILLQRLDDDRPAAGHVDIACSDVEAVAAWHESLGARRRGPGGHWLVMTDPTGGVYCLTSRDPITGKVP